MPATRNRFSCNHRGFGSYCHRCAQSEALEARAEALKAEGGKGKAEEVKALLEEAKRLKTTTVKRSSYDDLPDTPVAETTEG
jgi:hypothetical protein